MSYLLDTNILSEVRKPLPDERVLAWLAAQRLSETYLSVISIGELGEGIAKLGASRRAQELEVWLAQLTESFNGRLLAVDLEVVSVWGRIRAQARQRGRTAPADALIAATALVHDLTLVTRNVADVEMLPFKVFNPWESL